LGCCNIFFAVSRLFYLAHEFMAKKVHQELRCDKDLSEMKLIRVFSPTDGGVPLYR
jgi:hypothetical protein